MPVLIVVGGGLFGSLAAALARRQGIETLVFDPGLPGAASPAAAGLFQEAWMSKKWQHHYQRAIPLLEQLYGIGQVRLTYDDGSQQSFLFVPPTRICEAHPIRQRVTAVGDGWVEANGERHEGWVYVSVGVWSTTFLPDLKVTAKAGASFLFPGERAGQIRSVGPGRQALAFVRDPGSTYFSDGTAEVDYLPQHDLLSLERAAALGLSDAPLRRFWGQRPYTPGGPVFRRLGRRTWLATGGRKMGTLLGASLAHRLVEDELRHAE